MVFRFRGSDPAVSYDYLYDVPIFRCREVNDVPWAELARVINSGTRIIVQHDPESLPLDVLYFPRNHRRLIVGFHGLENRRTSDLPKFQFVTSFFRSREESLLFLSDTTMLLDDNVSIAWMCGDAETDLAAEYTKLIRALNRATQIEETVLVGHSAGGTAAIRVGAGLPNSRAIAVNSQLSAEYFESWTLDNLRRAVSADSETTDKFLEEFRSRLDLRNCLDNRAPKSSFSWFTHKDDPASVSDHPNYPEIIKFFNLGAQGGITSRGDAILLCDWDAGTASSHALPGSVLPFVRAVLGEATQFDLSIISAVSPEWTRQGELLGLEYRGSDVSMNVDPTYDAPIFRYSHVDEIPWASLIENDDQPARIIVQSSEDDLPLDVLFIPRQSRRLLVGIHGAESRESSDLPKFQFVRSFKMSRTESLLFISDSTMLVHEKLSIAWMVGRPHFDVAEKYASLIRSLNYASKIEETVLVGHSAGGTMAVRIGTMIPQSHAVAVNAQLAADFYFDWAVTNLRTRAFGDYESNREMLDDLRHRLDLRIALRNRVACSRFTWFTHRKDSSSFGSNPSFPELVRFYGLPETGGVTVDGDRIILCDWYTEQENKHGLPGSVLPFVRESLGEDPRFALNIIDEESEVPIR